MVIVQQRTSAFSPLPTERLVIELEGRNSTRVRSAVILLWLFCEIVRYGGSSAGASSVDRYAQERGSYASDRQDRGGYESGSSSGYGGSDRGYGAPDRGYGPPPDRGYGPPPERSRAGYGPPSDRPYSAGSYSSGGLLNISCPWLLFHLWKGRKTRSSLFVSYLSRRVEYLTWLGQA